jgi:hypothetical protein
MTYISALSIGCYIGGFIKDEYRGGILGGNPDRSLKSFPPCYSQTPLLTECTPHLLFFGLEISTSNSWEGGGVFGLINTWINEE